MRPLPETPLEYIKLLPEGSVLVPMTSATWLAVQL